MTDSPAAAPIRVLVVDDHELVRAGLRAMLSAHSDIEIVAEAGTGAQALGMARAHRPDVVLLDARLPDIGGAEVCRRLRQNHPATVVAMLTTYSDDELVRDCVRAGAQGYLLKSASPIVVADGVRRVLDGGVYADPSVASLLAAGLRGGPSESGVADLSAREIEVLRLVADGKSNKQIGETLSLSALTVKSHLARISRKLGTGDRAEMVALAMRSGVIR